MSDKKIGFWSSTSLVAGNMIGSGVFLLPASLAAYGSISLLGWLFSSLGALLLAKVFGNLGRIAPNTIGGPYAYTRLGLGELPGFLVAWGYWISIWCTNAAIAVALVGYLEVFFPVLGENKFAAIATGLGVIWFFTWINTLGIKESGKIQLITTIIKIMPIIFIIIIGAFFFDINNLPSFNLTAESDFSAFSSVATLTLFAFLGIESATIPAGNIENPEKTIPRATMIGTLIVTILYVFGTIVLFGILPLEVLQKSPAPFAEAAKIIGGDYGGYFVAVGVIVSGLGVLNGWILITGQISMSTAKDDLFPSFFERENKKGAPVLGFIIGGVLSSAVMLMSFSEGLVDQFEFIVQLTVFVALVPYLFSAAAYALIIIEKKIHPKNWVKTFVLATFGFGYSLWAIYGSGSDTVYYGFLLLLLGIPV